MADMGWTVETASHETGDIMTELGDLKKRFMADLEFRKEYSRADEEYALVEESVRARTAAKLHSGGGRPAARHDPGGDRAAGRRPVGAVHRDLAPLRRGARRPADRGPGAGR